MDSTALAQMSMDQVPAIISGYAAFGTTLALSTMLQKMVGISTTTKLLPRVLGFASVCGASIASQRVALLTNELRLKPEKRNFRSSWLALTAPPDYRNCWEVGSVRIPRQEATACLVGLSAYVILGGKFRSVSPSSFSGAGSFARKSIPAESGYASKAQKSIIHSIGKKYGCHTCGSKVAPFIADHVPPRSVGERLNQVWYRRFGLFPKVQYRFFPHCQKCSSQQAHILGEASSTIAKRGASRGSAASFIHSAGGRNARFHGLRFRKHHLSGGLIAGASLYNQKNGKRPFRPWGDSPLF
eukprot:Nitzschia sp. Nitz4//scaffold399_size11037//416//1392//NITZ4_009049-RA/size11037-augustus-gene-0.9-mRNA-1//-1//CDS//3329550316//6811//frame0